MSLYWLERMHILRQFILKMKNNVIGRVEQSETRRNDPNHAVERAAKKHASHGSVVL